MATTDAGGRAAGVRELMQAFRRLEAIDDPLRRKLELAREAEALEYETGPLAELFEAYLERRQRPRWLGRSESPLRAFEILVGRLVTSLAHLSFFALLEYVGRLAILVAILSFFWDLPKRRRELHFESLETVQAAEGRVYSGSRMSALEQLNRDCVELEGIRAPSASLDGVRLDRCSRWFRYRGADLRGAYLEGASLRAARLRQADLTDAVLRGADLTGADLRGADLRGADLAGANLTRALLDEADFQGAVLTESDLSWASLRGAQLLRVEASSAKLVRADLSQARVEHSVFAQANLIRADLRGASLFRSSLEGALLLNTRIDERASRSARLSADQVEDLAGAQGGPRVGLIVNDDQFFFSEIQAGALKAAEELGGRLLPVRTVSPAAEGPMTPAERLERELALIWELVLEGMEILAILPQDRGSSVPAFERAYDRGVVIACYDNCIDTTDRARLVASFFGSDQFALGYSTGSYVGSWWQGRDKSNAEEARIAIFNYCEFEGCYRRVQGFREGLDRSGIAWREVAYQSEEGLASEAAADLLLEGGGELDAVWSANEQGTVALAEALCARDASSRPALFGTDISPELEKYLKSDSVPLLAVTAQGSLEMAYSAVMGAYGALQGRYTRPELRAVSHRLYTR